MSGQRAVLGARQRQPRLQFGEDRRGATTAAADSERIGRGESMPQALANPADRLMTIRGLIARLTQQEDLNFLLTNRIPRAALTRFMGWFSKIENPFVRDASIACWRLFSDLDLSEAEEDRIQEPARLLYARTAPRAASGRSRSGRRGQSVRRHHRRASARSRIPSCSRSRARLIRCSTCSAIPRWWSSTATAASLRCG